MMMIKKMIATTISLTMLVLSLAVISPTTAIAKGKQRTGNTAPSKKNLRGKSSSLAGTGSRSAISGTKRSNPTVTMLDYEGQTVVTYSRKRGKAKNRAASATSR